MQKVPRKKEYKTGDRIPYAERFERELADYLQIKYCYAVNSGSSANLLTFMALTSPLFEERQALPGNEIITVAAGLPTTVTPMQQYGAVPVFVDVTIPQYNMDTFMLEEAFSEKTKAVMVAHTPGNPFDLPGERGVKIHRNNRGQTASAECE